MRQLDWLAWMPAEAWRPELQPCRLRFYNEVWLQTEDDSHDALIFKEMPAALRAVVAFDLTNGLIKQVPVLCNLDEQHQRGLVSKLVPISIRPGVDICQEGDDADSVWILQEGARAKSLCLLSFRVRVSSTESCR